VPDFQGMVDPGEHVSVTLKREFGEEALNSLEADPEERSELLARIDEFFQNGCEVRFRFIMNDSVLRPYVSRQHCFAP